ncbi:12246_t:CDS:2 [Funneliformis mosseae]|uniref:12246_t:CDS:1 n=1 Tax=Funneliformis mosseae TaxID=27381 RepID=A0A9N9AZC9_FUNMO|nr:12246_t:CDS:2 [Funneliformis mosseae]
MYFCTIAQYRKFSVSDDLIVIQEFAIIDDNIILETLTNENIIQSIQPTQKNNEKNEEIVLIQLISSMIA